MDGIILVHEVLHSVRTKKIHGMLVKLDIVKACDKLNWHFMREILKSFGSQDRWIDWVMSLVSLAFFSILVNGVPSGILKLTRGIKQGGPLSPFIFIIMVEGLGRTITTLWNNHDLQGILVRLRADK